MTSSCIRHLDLSGNVTLPDRPSLSSCVFTPLPRGVDHSLRCYSALTNICLSLLSGAFLVCCCITST